MQADKLVEGKRDLPTNSTESDLVHATYRGILGQAKAKKLRFVNVRVPSHGNHMADGLHAPAR